ncbi:YcaO-like family protein, partial [Streptomyces sp. WAC06614]|uniref:YcaO-like family protein n=1 Tax=Streptomyces sp. WAC06614 TaxID=2487416 RepID=UPI000FAD7283
HHAPPSPEPTGRDLDADLADLVGLLAADGHHVLRVDLTPRDPWTPEHARIPVVRVVVPGARFAHQAGN